VKDALGDKFGVIGGPMGSPLANLATWGIVRKFRSPWISQVSVIVICHMQARRVLDSAGHERIMCWLSSGASPQRRHVGLRPGCCSDWW
jgi:hypothetical protein